MKSSFLYNPPDAGKHGHAASLARDAERLLAVWYSYPVKEHENGRLAFAAGTIVNQWGKASKLDFDIASSCGNPVIFVDGSGKLWLFFVLIQGNYWNDAVVYIASSTDGGLTWSKPRNAGLPAGVMLRHQPYRRSNGDLLLPAYDEETKRTLLMRAERPDAEWKQVYQFPENFIQAVSVPLGGTELQLYFRPCGNNRFIHRAYSHDDGDSWSDPIPIPLPCPLSGIAVAALGDLILVAHNHTTHHQRTPMSISWSSDRGLSWQGPWHIDESALEVSYPTMLTTQGETAHLLYTYNRRMIKYVSFTREELEARQ